MSTTFTSGRHGEASPNSEMPLPAPQEVAEWDNDRLNDLAEYHAASAALKRQILAERTKRFGQAQKGKQKAAAAAAAARASQDEEGSAAAAAENQRLSLPTVDFQSEDNPGGRSREQLVQEVAHFSQLLQGTKPGNPLYEILKKNLDYAQYALRSLEQGDSGSSESAPRREEQKQRARRTGKPKKSRKDSEEEEEEELSLIHI